MVSSTATTFGFFTLGVNIFYPRQLLFYGVGTDGHGLGLYCLNNGVIVQTIKGSVIREICVRDFLSSPEGR